MRDSVVLYGFDLNLLINGGVASSPVSVTGNVFYEAYDISNVWINGTGNVVRSQHGWAGLECRRRASVWPGAPAPLHLVSLFRERPFFESVPATACLPACYSLPCLHPPSHLTCLQHPVSLTNA